MPRANGDDFPAEAATPSSHFKEALARVTAYAQEAMDEIVRSKGEIMRELGLLHRLISALTLRVEGSDDKLDAHIGDVRAVLTELRGYRNELRESIRPKLASLHDQQEVVTQVTHRLSGVEGIVLPAEEARKLKERARKKLIWAAAKGGATALGGLLVTGFWLWATGHLHFH